APWCAPWPGMSYAGAGFGAEIAGTPCEPGTASPPVVVPPKESKEGTPTKPTSSPEPGKPVAQVWPVSTGAQPANPNAYNVPASNPYAYQPYPYNPYAYNPYAYGYGYGAAPGYNPYGMNPYYQAMMNPYAYYYAALQMQQMQQMGAYAAWYGNGGR